MAERRGPHLYTIPSYRAFADALADGLLRRYGKDQMTLARGVILLPNNRAIRTISDAFVRASGNGLLLPRPVAIGDPELDESAGPFIDPVDDAEPIPPAVDPLQRRMILARLVAEERQRSGEPVDAAEAVRLAGELARTLDQLLVEEVPPHALRQIELTDGLSQHWEASLRLFEIVLDRWPKELERLGRIDLAERRRRLLDRVARHWKANPPAAFVCAAGITGSAPAVARMLRTVADLPTGMVVLPGLATNMPDDQWDALGPHPKDSVTGRRKRSIETHPQFHLKLLLDRMSVARGEVRTWRGGSEHDADPPRSRAIANALAPPEFTRGWTDLPSSERRLSGVSVLELAGPGDEAQAVAIALRQALETPERTAALVTPDRALARRVAAHCARWNIAVDDSAGQPLSMLPPGTFLLALAEAAAQHFAPLPLLGLLKHPLVRAGEGRTEWLGGVRLIDLALRGPRPAMGLSGIDAHLADQEGRTGAVRRAALAPWEAARPLLEPIAATFAAGPQPMSSLIAAMREAAEALCGEMLWSRPDGRQGAQLLDALEREGDRGPALVDPASLGPMLRTLMDESAVRPQQGGHPRLAIYGLLEAQLQTADVMVLAGLNEGVWPGLPSPDPWLAPRIRSELNLPGLERRIGLSAHDLANALGGQQVLLTRARRDASAPTIASRFWLRLEALSGGLSRATDIGDWAMALDRPETFDPVDRPAPCPPVADRPTKLSVTEVDRLKADPFAFYARRMLGLSPLDAVDADPSAAWRGTEVHRVLEIWAREDQCDPTRLRDRALAMLKDAHPMMRALWQPRLMEAIDWIAAQLAAQAATGRSVIDVEKRGEIAIAGVTLSGTYDRIDRLPDGGLAIVDYKTGKPPSPRAVRAGFSLQLGLLGLIAERGGFANVDGTARAFEYWSLSRNVQGGFGYIDSPVDPKKKEPVPAEDFVAIAAENFTEACARWLTGAEPFTAKLNPEYANYPDYDQLMRRDEWYGRERG
ncbi:double-strand break repair protein AddB [Stakelama pacifica]|uniref:ATP-dependent helicase/nuclease subunit B n=1 Tax=Stakelama pacifica TaxID=517720 RepID=A0A4V3BSM5_9SPHN|nr:double-strand break repair protein AddB [Stakelama pacifica]TDN79948.1 ATP-dependent helicase/nuclease subunit B [Stakelama pacifica]GGO98301.1 double-strand break repair protein AddB [Stakelama pacifica]